MGVSHLTVSNQAVGIDVRRADELEIVDPEAMTGEPCELDKQQHGLPR